MSVKCSDVTHFMEELAPTNLAEEWDNVGLMLGNESQEVHKILLCLDVSSKVVDEAIAKKVDMIISHHPLIFKGLKRISENDFKGNLIYKLIRANISVYSAHTNLDVAENGVNDQLAKIIGLDTIRNLKEYKSEKLYKLVVYVPEDSIEKVRDAVGRSGAGWIGNYSDCTFMTKGIGTFKPSEGTNPYIGAPGSLEKVDETKLETIVPKSILNRVLKAMLEAHPYEEAAYDIYPLEIKGKTWGLGKVGTLAKPQKLGEFLETVKKQLKVDNLRVIGNYDKEVKKVAVFCGSFDEDYNSVLKEKVDVLVTGDIKHHAALDMAEMGMCVVDAGHYATERIIVPALADVLKTKFSGIEVISSELENNPVSFS